MKRGTRYLFLLLVAASAQNNTCNSDLKRQLNQIENEQMLDNCRMKSTMDRILQSVEANNKKMEDLMSKCQDDNLQMKLMMDRILLSVEQSNKKQMESDLMMKVLPVKEQQDCQKISASWPLIERNATMFFKAMGRTFYYNRTQYGTWNETRDWCSSRGMQLATLKTAEELKQVVNTLKSKILSPTVYGFWVSASDIGRSPGQFHWADGTPVLNSTWQSGEPDNHQANQETCAHIATGYEKLWDYRCSGQTSTLCEVPKLLATCL